MKLSLRSFPHPVVGNRDDVPGVAFQATTEMTTDSEYAYVDTKVTCSSSTINKLVQEGNASFVVHVECGNTLFRKAYPFRQSEARFQISLQLLSEDVEVNVFAQADKDVPAYKVDKAHADYDTSTFGVERGDILAVAEGRVFTIESDFDSIRRIGSIMQITESHSDDEHPIKLNLLTDKLMVILSKKDFAQYKRLAHSESFVGPLSTIIVLPALMAALQHVRDEYADEEARESAPRWVRLLYRRVEAMQLKFDSDNLELSQQLLDLPVRRALSSTAQMLEGDSNP